MLELLRLPVLVISTLYGAASHSENARVSDDFTCSEISTRHLLGEIKGAYDDKFSFFTRPADKSAHYKSLILRIRADLKATDQAFSIASGATERKTVLLSLSNALRMTSVLSQDVKSLSRVSKRRAVQRTMHDLFLSSELFRGLTEATAKCVQSWH